ncbi:MAG: tetratricopeptide repeat protein [Armatimonadetes bacterium]|nr:tetratricopeptide repeat protein [Armatimonadota bacterium]
MSALDKWFVFGKSALFDQGLRTYEQQLYADAAVSFEQFISEPSCDLSLAKIARLYLAESLAHLAAQAMDEGNFSAARDLYTKALKLQSGFADLWFQLARVHRALTDSDFARECLDRCLDLNPRFASAKVLSAAVSYDQGEFELAMNSLIDAVHDRPSLEDDLYREFVLLHNSGKFEDASAVLTQICESKQDTTQSLIEEAKHLLSNREVEKAATMFSRAVEIVPNYADVRCCFGQCLIELDQLEAAQKQIEAAIEINPNYADAHAALGVIFRRTGKEAEAKASFGKALDINAHHPVASVELARLKR